MARAIRSRVKSLTVLDGVRAGATLDLSMAARSIATASISFGLVTVPVRIYPPATRPRP
jgi:hypothetical protein